MSREREIYFHEDDYCQQELLPRGAVAHAEAEIKQIGDFADAHRAPGGLGWTDIYIRKEAPLKLRSLRIDKGVFAQTVSPFLEPFDVVLTGYSSCRVRCNDTCAWGRAEGCALFAKWDYDRIISHTWAEFFDQDEASILAATQAVAALGRLYPLVYVDWAYGYTCDASDEDSFAAMLRNKLKEIWSKASEAGTP